MAKDLKKGDPVTWTSSQGTIEGEVEKKLTTPTDIKGRRRRTTRSIS